jgi:DNA-binding GntR family transcriptional regulator
MASHRPAKKSAPATRARAATGKKAKGSVPRRTRDESSVNRIYLTLRDRAMRYEMRPGERINEQELGRELGVSRTPLREALNRLESEGFLLFVMNKGFFRKPISVDEVVDLYQVRVALERRAVFLATTRASDEEIASVGKYWGSIMQCAPQMNVEEMLSADEEFHRQLVALSHNRELSMFLEQVTRRIHIARHIDVEQSDWNNRAFDAHTRLVELIARRDKEAALILLTEHIEMSLKRALEITKEMTARFFLQDIPAFE